MGRPPKRKAEKMRGRVTVRMTEADLLRLQRQARDSGKAMAEILLQAWREKEE